MTATGYTTTGAVPLYWVAHGEADRETLLVLHGGPGAQHDYLLPQMLQLAQRHRLLFYDQRGSGKSPTESRDAITWQTHVDDLHTLIQELQLHPLTIVGYSWGGLLAMLYTLGSLRQSGGETFVAPARLVLIDPAPASSKWRKQMEAEFSRRQNSEVVRNLRQELNDSGLRESDPEAYRRRLFELSVIGYFHDPGAVSNLTSFRVSGRIQESVWRSLGEYDIRPSLERLSLPVLVVHGRDDPIPMQSSIEVAEALAARLLILEKCGHVPYVERPGALFSAIEQFLDDNPVHAPE